MIPFKSRPHITGDELDHICEAISNLHLSANGEFTAPLPARWLAAELDAPLVLLTSLSHRSPGTRRPACRHPAR